MKTVADSARANPASPTLPRSTVQSRVRPLGRVLTLNSIQGIQEKDGLCQETLKNLVIVRLSKPYRAAIMIVGVSLTYLRHGPFRAIGAARFPFSVF
jgi:hypothetical protein